MTKVEKGKKIIGISTEEAVFQAGELTVKCTESSVTGEVTNAGADGSGVIEVTISAATFSGVKESTKCDGGIIGPTKADIVGLPWCLKAGGDADTWTLTGADACGGNGTFTFILTSAIVTCTYKRANTMGGIFDLPAADGPTTLTVAGNPEFETEQTSTAFCPAGPLKIAKMAFKLYTDVGTYMESEANPIWASKY